MDSQGRVVVSGHDNQGGLVVARYAADGQLDTIFNTEGIAQLDASSHTLAFGSDDSVFVAGSFGNSGGDFRVIKFSSAGNVDTYFGDAGVASFKILDGIVLSGDGPDNRPVSVAVYDDSKIVLVGSVGSNTDENRYIAIIRLTPTGDLDTTFIE